MKKDEIVYKVDVANCEESNMFLRKLYDTMDGYFKGGWQVEGYRKDNRIFFGYSAFGEVSIVYKTKGIIEQIIIVNRSEENRKLIRRVLDEVNATYRNSMKNYVVTVSVYDNDSNIFRIEDESDEREPLRIIDCASNNISCNYDGESKKNYIKFNIKAYGKLDVKYVFTQKYHHLLHLLCLYTNHLYGLELVEIREGEYYCCDIDNPRYDNKWIESNDIFCSYSEMMLGRDMFEFFDLILRDMVYDDDIVLILNAIQQFYIANIMKRDSRTSGEYNIPGYVDTLNTVLVSALEPISNIGAAEPQSCPQCGNLVYSIRKKVKDLCERYMPSNITKLIATELYSERSKFLHEGRPITNEFYCGRSFPLLDPVAKNKMMMPVTYIHYEAFDYVSYIVRRIIEDSLRRHRKNA